MGGLCPAVRAFLFSLPRISVLVQSTCGSMGRQLHVPGSRSQARNCNLLRTPRPRIGFGQEVICVVHQLRPESSKRWPSRLPRTTRDGLEVIAPRRAHSKNKVKVTESEKSIGREVDDHEGFLLARTAILSDSNENRRKAQRLTCEEYHGVPGKVLQAEATADQENLETPVRSWPQTGEIEHVNRLLQA